MSSLTFTKLFDDSIHAEIFEKLLDKFKIAYTYDVIGEDNDLHYEFVIDIEKLIETEALILFHSIKTVHFISS